MTDQPLPSGTAVTQKSCYDAADRLTKTDTSAIGTTLAYDSRGRTTTLGVDHYTYDAADRHVSTTAGSTTVGYVRDPQDRIIARTLAGVPTACYGYTGDGDTPDQTLGVSGSVCSATAMETTYSLPGGATVTKRGSTATDVWSLSNIHGDTLAITNGSGVKQGTTLTYNPDGSSLGALPDNSAGNFDNAWEGQHQRPLEHEPGLQPTIEMGARPYNVALGRFLAIDPVLGGTRTNDYGYVADPVNVADLNGMKPCGGCGRDHSKKRRYRHVEKVQISPSAPTI